MKSLPLLALAAVMLAAIDESLRPLAELGAMGILAAYLILDRWYYAPQRDQQFLGAMRQMQEQYIASLDQLGDRIESLDRRLSTVCPLWSSAGGRSKTDAG